MNPTILGVIGPGFLNQVPTLSRLGGSGSNHHHGISSSTSPSSRAALTSSESGPPTPSRSSQSVGLNDK